MIYNRTEAASALLATLEEWCARTGTSETSVGHVLFLHPGFAGLLRKRLTVSEEKEAEVLAFLAEHPTGWSGDLPLTHANGTRPVKRDYEKIRGRRPPRIKAQESFVPSRVDRDPCPRCGVRHDIGCAHTRAPVGMMFS